MAEHVVHLCASGRCDYAAQVGLVEGKLRTVQARCGQLQAAFEAMVAGSLPMRSTLGYARYATCWAPQHASTGRWVFAFEASTHWGLAAGMLSALQSDRDLASSGERGAALLPLGLAVQA